MEPKPTDAERRGSTSQTSRLIGAGLVVTGVLLAALVISPWLRPQPAEPTPVPAPTLAPTAAVPAAVVSPVAGTSVPASQVPSPATSPAAPATPAPATPTSLPSSLTTQPAATPGEGRYLGRDPLPSGVDLTNGPFLKELKSSGYPGVSVGDGGLGDQLKAAYLEALKVEVEALNTGDDSRLRQHFTGEALDSLMRRTARIRSSTSSTASAYEYKPLVMAFIPQTAKLGVYEVVDARTQSIATVDRLPDGAHGKVIKPGEPERACYSVQMQKEDGSWKVEFEEAHHDGSQGGKCPPYWS